MRKYLELIRFSHTVFALPFALLGAVMAWTTPGPDGSVPAFHWRDLGGILLCMVFARSAAMAFNRLADRKIDAGNPRTATRHLPAGLLTPTAVSLFTLLMSAGFVASTCLFLPNAWPLRLSVPVLLFLFGYSYTKRFTSLAHFWLGAALLLTPVCAWIALRGQWLADHPGDLLPAVWLGVAVLSWVSGFDIIYACQDYDFDVKAKLHSIPVRLGLRGALRLAAACHAAMMAALIALPLTCPQVAFGWMYWTALVGVSVLLIIQHALVRPTDLSRVNLAFFQVNAIVSIGLFIVGALDLFFF